MIKVYVMYPNEEGKPFDMDYYLGTHIPLVQARLGAALKSVGVEAGVAGVSPEGDPAYVTVGWLVFDSLDAFQSAFRPHADEILGDIPNFTMIQPVIQIFEVKV